MLKNPTTLEKVVLRVPAEALTQLKDSAKKLGVLISLACNSAIHLYINAKSAKPIDHSGKQICQIMRVPKYRMDAFRQKAKVSGHSLSKAFEVGVYLLMEELKQNE
jgi:hypothetical protein